MTDRHPSLVAFVMLLLVFATVMLFVLFTAVTKVRADVIRPSVDRGVISRGASDVSYDAETGFLSVADETSAFTHLPA